jgi:uncharacterized protein (TIGR04255 family)
MQFQPLGNLRAVHIGLLWLFLGRNNFPTTEEQPPVSTPFERIGLPRPALLPRIQLLNMPLLPRYLFINPSGNEILQVQSDRFAFNWRKRGDDDVYPRYEYVRSRFEYYVKLFEEFLSQENIGTLKATQAEIAYVNQVESIRPSGQLKQVISVFSGDFSDDFLSSPEETHCSLRFPIKTDQDSITGRLYVEMHPNVLGSNEKPIAMTLVARGKPESDDVRGTMSFFDLGRKWIVSGFASITSTEMHKKWGRRDEPTIN